MDGHVDDAIRLLQGQLTAHTSDGETHLLLCRAYFSEQQTDTAIHECEAAAKLMPGSSPARDWLGRAYGVKASGAGPLSGLKLAHRVHDAFEAAFALDPHNAAAANDLAEYYVGAPSMVGGGLDKATALAAKVESDMPQLAHRIRGLAAEKSKNYVTAEREYQAAADVRNAPDAWVDLGGFYKNRNQSPKAVDALEHAITLDKAKDPALVDAASFLIDMHSSPDIAMKALQQYLAGSAKSDAAPAARAHLLLGQIFKSQGDKVAAAAEWNKALALASNYAPAKRALQEL